MRLPCVRRACSTPPSSPLEKLSALLPLFLLVTASNAPISWAQETVADQETRKFWIYFEDKAEPTSSAGEPAITERALQRRLSRGRTDAKWLDLPINVSYLDALRDLGVTPVIRSRWLNAISAHLSEPLLDHIRGLNFVRSVQPVAVAQSESTRDLDLQSMSGPHAKSALNLPSKPDFTVQRVNTLDYGPSAKQLLNINAIEVLERGINGSGVLLGFLDTPYQGFQHTAFEHLTESGRLVEIRDFVGQPQSATHGMSVASAAVGFVEGQIIGPAYGAEVLAAITEYAPSETNQEEDFFVAGMEWMEAMGADVVNVSLGYTTFDQGEHSYEPGDLNGDTGVTTRAADHAASLGVVVVVSAGNSACAAPEDCWYYISTPADADSVITVGAVRPDSSRASFSSFGPTADGRTKPDIAAPGSSVYVAIPNTFAYASGTSFASPLVAAVVCQMLEVNPALTPMEIRDVLRQTASRAHAPNDSLGWGIINAAAAVEQAQFVAVEPRPSLPSALSTHAFPNPATDEILIHINDTVPGQAELTVYDVLGRVVSTGLYSVSAGPNAVRISVRDLSPGLYLYAVSHAEQLAAGKLIVR